MYSKFDWWPLIAKGFALTKNPDKLTGLSERES